MPGAELGRIAASRLALPVVAVACAVAMAARQFSVASDLSLRAYPDGGVIAANAFGLSRGSGQVAASSFFDQAASVQLAVYAKLTGAFSRQDTIAGAAHEYVVVMVAVGTIALIILGRLLGVAVVGCVTAAALVFLTPTVAGLQASAGVSTIASTWVLIGLALLAIRPVAAEMLVVTVTFGVLALVAAGLTAPVSLLVPVALVGSFVAVRAAGVGWSRAALAALVSAFILVAGAVGWLAVSGPWQVDSPAVPAGADPWLAIGGLIVAALALLRLSWLRPLAVTSVPLLIAALRPSPVQASALLIALPLAAILLVELLAQLIDRGRAMSLLAGRQLALNIGAAVAAIAVIVSVVLLPAGNANAEDARHVELADWLTHNTSASAVVAVQPVLWAELVRDGVPDTRLRVLTADGTAKPGQLRVTPGGGDPSEMVFASFGDGPQALTVGELPDGGAAALTSALNATLAQRRFGAALVDNPNLTAPAEVQAALASGSVDPRLLILLAGGAALVPFTVTALPVNAGDAAEGGPLREAVITAANSAVGRLMDYVGLQLTDYEPLSTTHSGSTMTIVYSIPSPVGLIG